MAGDVAGQHEILSRLAAALEVTPEAVAAAVQTNEALKEQAHRAAFVPYAIIVAERTTPSQVTFCALTRGETALRIALDTTRCRSSYPRQALSEIERRMVGSRREIAFFGPVLGFVVNYDQCRAMRFDIDGRALQLLPRAVQTGSSHWTIR